MGYSLVDIGFGDVLAVQKIVAIVNPASSPIRRFIEEAKQRGKLVDATHGRRTRALIITTSDHVILSAVAVKTIARRLMLIDVHRGAKNSRETTTSLWSKEARP